MNKQVFDIREMVCQGITFCSQCKRLILSNETAFIRKYQDDKGRVKDWICTECIERS